MDDGAGVAWIGHVVAEAGEELAEPEQAQAFMQREFAPRAMGARYDWLYEYDALTVPV